MIQHPLFPIKNPPNKQCAGCHCTSCIWRYAKERCKACYPDRDACDEFIRKTYSAHDIAKMERFASRPTPEEGD